MQWSCVTYNLIPVRRLFARLRVVRLLVVDSLDSDPVKPLPARCSVLRLDTENIHDGIVPWNEDRRSILQVDPTPIPSSIKVDIPDVHTIDGNVPVIQFSDNTNVLRLGSISKDKGSDPVRLMDDIII